MNIARKDCLDLLNQFEDVGRLYQVSRLLQTLLVTEAFQSELRKKNPQILEPREHQVACLQVFNRANFKELTDLKGHVMTKAMREYVKSGQWADIHAGASIVENISEEVDNDIEATKMVDSDMDIDRDDLDMGTDNLIVDDADNGIDDEDYIYSGKNSNSHSSSSGSSSGSSSDSGSDSLMIV